MAKHYKIVKRNGEIVPLDITKIRQVIEWAAVGLDINPIELESNLHMRFRNDMTTKEIQENIIDTALQLTSIDSPDWRILAARLKLMDLYKDIKFEKGYDTFGYDDYLRHVTTSVEQGLYDAALLSLYTNDEISTAGTFLDMRYDMDFDYAGANIMIHRYLITRENSPWELPQEAFLTAAMLIERYQPKDIRLDLVRDTYEKMAKRKLSLATPMLMNLRKPFGNLSSCFIVAFGDSRDSIFYVLDQIAKISKNGGGVGVNVSRVRCKGSWINGTPNASGGVIPWIRNINDVVVSVNQQGKRAGAATVALDSWHMDIEDFLELQTENGDHRMKAFDIFPQVVLSDEFMRRVEADKLWTLVDPHEIKIKFGVDIAEIWGTEFEKLYQQIENLIFDHGKKFNVDLENLSVEDFEKEYKELLIGKDVGSLTDHTCLKMIKRISAKNLFKTIMKTQVETGMPYLTFKDAMNRANPNKHDGMIGNGNLCLSGDTIVNARIDDSFVDLRMEELVEIYKENKNISVKSFDHETDTTEYQTLTDAFLTYEKSNVMKLTDSETGNYVICTPDHKIWTENRGYVQAKDLVSSDRLKIQ
jgi:ribonucleoside-diphosphate reductase alpha chain